MVALLPLKRYAQFSGRSGRAEYWQFVAFVIAAMLVGLLFDAFVGNQNATLSIGVLLACLVPIYAVTFRRLHDRNISGWSVGLIWVLNGISFAVTRIHDGIASSILAAPFVLIHWVVVLATLALAIYLLVQMAKPGDLGANRFGPPPHADDAIAASELRSSMSAMSERTKEFSVRPAASDPIGQIERLSKLHRDGVLTDAEFDAQKAQILRGNA